MRLPVHARALLIPFATLAVIAGIVSPAAGAARRPPAQRLRSRVGAGIGTTALGRVGRRGPTRGIGTKADFNGDGYSDLAIGVPGEAVGSIEGAGAVNVIYGAAGGLSATATPDQLWDQDSPNVEGTAEPSDFFGLALAAGDFNGDGYGDLAAGTGYEDVGSLSDSGAVNVIYGSPTGLSADYIDDELWDGDSPGIPGQAGEGDVFGNALVAGDFNGDEFVDLAVGAPGKMVSSVSSAGVVDVLYGGAGGLSADHAQQWSQESAGVVGEAEPDDQFGFSLAAGDFFPDGRADLAVGVPFEDIGSIQDAGGVNVLYGSGSGLSATHNQFWDQDSTGIKNEAEEFDRFGYSLAAGDLAGRGTDDLVVGVSAENVGGVVDAGGVNVVYGSPTGLDAANNQFWTQDTSGILGTAEKGDGFGSALTVGDFGYGTQEDLVVAARLEDVGSIQDAGSANVIFGSTAGLSASGNQLWTQDSQGVLDEAEARDFLGYAVGAGDFDGDGRTDVALGVFGEDLSPGRTLFDTGGVNVLYGGASGLSTTGNQFWTQDAEDVEGTAESSDVFGASVASG